MNIKDLKLINFRNYNNVDLELNKNINIFIGKNAQGKTNLIESIYMCSFGRSFRTNSDMEIINFNKDEAYIGANISLGNFNRFIEIKLDRNNPKIIRINKTPIDSQKELSSGLNIVIFSPEDIRISKDGPNYRRGFIDDAISQVKPVYNHNLSKYNKILYQRNNILKSNRFKNNTESLLEVFDVQIAKIGTYILIERSRYINKLNSISKDIHYKISSGKENLELIYDTNVPILESKENMEIEYLKLLKDEVNRDLKYGNTKIGPHRDDMIMNLNGLDSRIYGSQGQQRSVVLSLKLAEVEMIKKEKGFYPILLLDDVYSELDMDRRKYLSSLFGNMQTFITLSNAESLKSIESTDKTLFYIENGKIWTKND